MQVPKYAQPGQSAKELWVQLELKVIADVGLVGFPNVGKSTFLSRVTNARPKIANYHFTTLNPNLGVVDLDGGKGFVIAFILAFAFGMLRAMIPASAGYYEYLVQFFKNVPPLSMIPLLILWCGIGETTKTVIIVLASFFPMYLNIVKGFTGCDRKLLEVGTMFGYTERQKFFCIMLPYAMADILVGMRIGLGYSWRAIIGAEMVAASTGLGHMILFAQQMSRTDKVIVGIFAIGIAGYLTDRIFGLLISIFLKGAGENGWN